MKYLLFLTVSIFTHPHFYVKFKPHYCLCVSVILLFLLNLSNLSAQIAQFSFPATNSLVVSNKDANVSVTNMALSTGTTITTNRTTGSYFPNEPYIQASGGWTSKTQTGAKSYTFTITANPGYTFSITNISFRAYATSAGPTAYGIAVGTTNIMSVNAPSAVVVAVNSPVTGQIGLPSATIKIQGWLNGSRTATGGGSFRLDDVVVTGVASLIVPPTKLVITNINPTTPTTGKGFDVTIQTQDNNGVPNNVIANTSFSLSTNGLAGAIGGTTTGTIVAGSRSVVVTGVTLGSIGTGATLTATATSGDALTAATSSTFNVLPAASQLAFGTAPPISGGANINLTGFTVEARRPDNSIDETYTGTITIAKTSGTGTLSGSLTQTVVAGVVTFSDLQFTDMGTYTVTASASGLTSVTSGNIVLNAGNTTAVVWNNGATASTWTTTTSWLTNSFPQAGQVARFDAVTGATVITIKTSTASATNMYQIAGIEVTSARSSVLTIKNNLTTNDIITLTGATMNTIPNIILKNASVKDLTLDDATNPALSIALTNTTDNIINIENTGDITINSNISGNNTNLTKIGAGTGILTLTGANTYKGLTTVSAGTLTLSHTGGTTIHAENDIMVTGGVLNILSNQTLNNLTVNGGNVILADGISLNITGTLTLTSGTITTGTSNITAATIVGGSSDSYIVTTGEGALIQNVSSATSPTLTFSVGTADTYRPVTVAFSANTTASGTLAGRFIASAPTSTGLPLTNEQGVTSLGSISPTGYWSVVSSTDLGGTYAITVDASDFNKSGGTTAITDMTNIRLIKRALGGSWTNSNSTTTTDPTALSDVTTRGLTSFSEFGIAMAEAVLAVEILQFDAYFDKGKTNVIWQTAQEKDNNYFDVQHSTNGSTFYSIGHKKGKGTTKEKQTYSYEHLAPSVGLNYYRLRQVDWDKKESYSRIISVLSNAETKIQILPTFVTDILTVRTFDNTVQSYAIFDMSGQIKQNGQLIAQKDLILNDLSAGMYILKVGEEVARFFKN